MSKPVDTGADVDNEGADVGSESTSTAQTNRRESSDFQHSFKSAMNIAEQMKQIREEFTDKAVIQTATARFVDAPVDAPYHKACLFEAPGVKKVLDDQGVYGEAPLEAPYEKACRYLAKHNVLELFKVSLGDFVTWWILHFLIFPRKARGSRGRRRLSLRPRKQRALHGMMQFPYFLV